MNLIPKLEIRNLSIRCNQNPILTNINLTIPGGIISGLIGKSGSGKSTLFKFCFGLLKKEDGYESKGEVLWNGKLISKETIPSVVPIFQDSYSSFSPFGTIQTHLLEPFKIRKFYNRESDWQEKDELLKIEEYLDFFDLPYHLIHRNKRELSGGQLQRFNILRALLCNPKFLLMDEPVTAVDVLVQKKISDLILKLNKSQNLGILVVSHDLGFLKYICEDLHVLEKGSIVESGGVQNLMQNPKSEILNQLIHARKLN